MDVVGENGSGLLSGIIQIDLGYKFACALDVQDKVWCWGEGNYGKLGSGSTGNKNYPVPVIAGSGSSSSLRGIVEIVSSTSDFLCLERRGQSVCVGDMEVMENWVTGERTINPLP